jgi:hypothetical protein
VAVGANEFAEDGDVGAVDADAASVDGKPEAFGEIEIDTGIVQFRKAVALRGRNTVEAGRIDRPGRTMTAPGAASQFVELPPIAFLPSGHGDKSLWSVCHCVFAFFGNPALSSFDGWFARLDAQFSQKVRSEAYSEHGVRTVPVLLLQAQPYCRSSRRSDFPCPMFQTRK